MYGTRPDQCCHDRKILPLHRAVAGYDAWISPEWSLGGMLRLSGAVTSSNADDLEQRANTRSFAILFTALYH